MNLILLGAPGAGKGTVAELLQKMLPLTHVSTGDLFRKNIAEGTDLGVLAKSYIDQGALVPDEVTISMIEDRLNQPDCKAGFMLDGFPRNLAQAESLDQLLEKLNLNLDLVLRVDLDSEEIVRRVAGRRVCPNCGASYHVIVKPPKSGNRCDLCGTEIIQRSDDREETVKVRLETFEKNTKPLIDFYTERGLVKTLDNSGSLEQTQSALIRIIEEVK